MKNTLTFFLFGFLYCILGNAQSVDVEWVKSIGGVENESIQSILTDDIGNIYIKGSFSDTVDFNPEADTFNLSSANGSSFILKLDPRGSFVWAKSLSSILETSMDIDDLGNLYMTGYFRDTVDFDPGIDTCKLISLYGFSSEDAFVLKLDSRGNFVWAKSIGGLYAVQGNIIRVDHSGNIYTIGEFVGPVDFDPGPESYYLPFDNLNSRFFISKMDSDGNFIWAKSIDAECTCCELDNKGSIYITGEYYNTVDFDPGEGVNNLTSKGYGDIFILKLDALGNFVWVKTFGSSLWNEYINSISLDSQGNIYSYGFFMLDIDFDPGVDTFILSSEDYYRQFVQKLDSDGNFNWAINTAGSNSTQLSTDTAGNVFLLGLFSDTTDFNPGVGINNLINTGTYSYYLQKLNTSGEFVSAEIMDFSFPITGTRSLLMDDNRNIIYTGSFYDTMYIDKSKEVYIVTSNGNNDVFVMKLSQDSCLNMTLIFDSVADINCNSIFGYASVKAIRGQKPYAYSWNTDSIISESEVAFSSPGIYELNVVDSNLCSRTTSLLIKGPGNVDGFDLNANMFSQGFRKGFLAKILLDAFNDGCVNTSGQLILVLNRLVSFENSIPFPDSISGDTLIWNYESLAFDSEHLQPVVFCRTSVEAELGDIVCFDLDIYPIYGDVDTSNNKKKYCFDIINSFDPNDKQVYPICETSNILNNQDLTYTIRFQNTGNAEAINIYIIDTLNNLDINTVRVLGTSHEPMITEVLPGNVLKFRFDSILLQDSIHNEPESHGFVVFTVKPESGLPIGTVIENNSAIYFDYNLPVITNTMYTTIVNEIPECIFKSVPEIIDTTDTEIIDTIDTDSADNYIYNKSSKRIDLYPNPNKGIVTINLGDFYNSISVVLYNMTGQQIIKKDFSCTDEITMEFNVPEGMYFLRVTSNDFKEEIFKIVRE